MSDRSQGSLSHPPFFNGSNYSVWKNKMRFFLRSQDNYIWYIIQHGYSEPTKKVENVEQPKYPSIGDWLNYYLFFFWGGGLVKLILSAEQNIMQLLQRTRHARQQSFYKCLLNEKNFAKEFPLL